MNKIDLYIDYFQQYTKKEKLIIDQSQAQLLQHIVNKSEALDLSFFVNIYQLPLIVEYLNKYVINIFYICPDSIEAFYHQNEILNISMSYDDFFLEYVNTINILNLFMIDKFQCFLNLYDVNSEITSMKVDTFYKLDLLNNNFNVTRINNFYLLRNITYD